MRAAQVDVALGDGGHAQLVVGAREEGGQRAGKHHVPLPRGTAHGNAHLKGRHREVQVVFISHHAAGKCRGVHGEAGWAWRLRQSDYCQSRHTSLR